MRLQKRCFTLVISLFLAAALLIQGQPSLAAELSEQTPVETEEVQEEPAGEPEEEEPSEETTGEEGQDAEEDADLEDLEFEEYLEMARTELKEITDQDVVMALVYLCDSYQVRKTADAEGEVCVSIPTGTTVEITGMDVDADWQLWFQVSLSWKDTSYTGYIQTGYLAYSNEKLMEWENMYFPQVMLLSAGNYPDVEQFPASYQNKLTQLKKAHPNWVFVKQNTGLDWQTVIKNENIGERSLIQTKMGSAYTNGAHGQPGWSYASEAAIKYYMDPRNFLDETRVFMFEQLTYNPSYHTQSAVQNILNSTFMKGSIPGDSKTYAAAFFDIGSTLKVSPFHLACRVYQEQGKGESALISGTYSGYEGYYNYYNIKASGSSNKAIIENGLTYAKQQGWNSRYKSLQGGAKILSQNYILKGQDTLYLQKYDVDNSYNGLYAHQYMQNIMAPYTESSMVKSAYQSTGAINNSFVFKIPVYLNMPSEACAKPGSTPAPTATPTATPSATPTATPSATPTATPSATPSATPTPTGTPSAKPTAEPTATAKATLEPTAKPTTAPTATAKATQAPTATPSATPTATPSATPTATPSATPSATPTPTGTPSAKPTAEPTATAKATPEPTAKPTATPTAKATQAPTAKPTATAKATQAPTAKPTAEPTATAKATQAPTAKPTATAKATPEPTAKPTATAKATPEPTAKPTATAKATPEPTAKPTATAKATPEPTAKPTATAKATQAPTAKPTAEPTATAKATQAPTAKPTATAKATQAPTAKPTAAPTATAAPTPVGQLSLPSPEPIPEGNGTASETQETEPVTQPAQAPTAEPTAAPVTEPLEAPEAENTEKGNAIVTAATPKPQTLSEDPSVLNMDMSAAGVIYAETLEQIRDQKTKVVLDVGNGVKWAIDGAEIEEGPMSNMDLKVAMGEGATRIPAERIEALTGGEEYVELSLAHEGSFGLKAVLTVTLDQAMEGQYANLFYYNEAEEAFEYICAAQISSRKEAAFVLGHASDYIIVISDRTREDLLTERAQQMEEADQAIEEIMSRPAEQRPAKDKNKAALIIALILLASAAIGIGAYLIFKKDRDE